MKPLNHIVRIAAALTACLMAAAPLCAQKVGSTSMHFPHVMPFFRFFARKTVQRP